MPRVVGMAFGVISPIHVVARESFRFPLLFSPRWRVREGERNGPGPQECSNHPGGFTCGDCPLGHRGSGYTLCVPASTCEEDNGGCDLLTSCASAAAGATECGPCPMGFTGTGATGCADEDGCAMAAADGGCYPGVPCSDIPAPGSGYTCGRCPVGMEGDGVSCWDDACSHNNGGCDVRVSCTNAASETTGRLCGACPTGYLDVLQDGTSCEEEDGCTAGAPPCFPGVACTDIPAPGTGVSCGECPAGYLPGPSGANPACEDVDECAEEDGGCDTLTTCENLQGGRACGDCPPGFMGTGEAGCRPMQTCDISNGGCHNLTTCAEVGGGVECGECPAGYQGSGSTVCEDIDGCKPEPCFPGVACVDVAAPGEGYTCGGCPEGYKGDGETCQRCELGLFIVSSTVADGKVKRAYLNQVIGELLGLTDPECVPSSDTTFTWAVSAGGTAVELTDERNQASTLRLTFAKSTLTTYLSYTALLSARVTASPEVSASAAVSFYVEPQALVALVTPSELQTGEDSEVVLDAAGSFDPDGEPGEMRFDWSCTRVGESERCRNRNETLLPTSWSAPTLHLSLQGSPEGLVYTFVLKVSKGAREAVTTVTVTMISGALPVPAIVALPGKVNANARVILQSFTESGAPASVARVWSMSSEPGTDALELAAAASTTLYGVDLVLKADVLMCGGTYLFKLNVADDFGAASTSLRVVVNQPPANGAVAVSPSEGFMLETVFQVTASGWEDDDTPLWYQVVCRVVGGAQDVAEVLAFRPQADGSSMLPESGLEEHARAVEVFVVVQDALGAVTTSEAVNVTVNPVELADDAALASYMDDKLAATEIAMSNDDVGSAMVLVDGLSSTMNTYGARRRSRRRRILLQGGDPAEEEAEDAAAATAREAQRESILDIVGAAQASVLVSDSSLQRMAASTARVMQAPEEVAAASQDKAYAILEGVVASAASADYDAALTPLTTSEVGHALSGLVTAGVLSALPSAAPNPASRGLHTLRGMAATLAMNMVNGEDPTTMASDVLTMRVQQEDLGDPASRAFGAPLDTPGGLSSVSFPESLGSAIGSGSTTITLLTSAVDPHLNLTGNDTAAAALRRSLLEASLSGPVGEEVSVSSVVTSIGLSKGEGGDEIAVRGLEEGITFTLPLDATAGGGNWSASVQCAFYDEAAGQYSGAGCASLPAPAPPGVALTWRSLNVSLHGTGEWGNLDLQRMWAVDAASSGWFLSGCEESFEAAHAEYLGTDAGLRKYLGEGCVAADPGNNVSCWWEWQSQAFFGPGCEAGTHVHCLCTHLTDFKATRQTEAGALEIPRGSALSTSDMTALSTDDLAESTTLLAVLAGLMLGAVLLAWLSNLVHEMEKKSILRNLMKHHGTDALWFKQVGDTWTWSLAEEEELQDIAGYNAILQPHSRRAQSLALQPDEEEAPKRLFPPASTIMKTLSAKITAPGSPSTRHLQEASMGGSEGDPREQWPVADHSMSLHTHNLILPIWVPQVDVAAGQTSQASHSLSDFTSLSLGVSQLAGQPTRSAGGLGKEPRASQRVEPAWRARSHRLEPLAQDSARQVRSGQLPATLEMEARAPSVSQPVVEAFTMPPQTMPGGLEDPRCSSPLESEASPTRPLLGGKLSDALASPEVARKQLQRVAQRLKVLVRAVVSKEKLKDFSTSEELCAVLGVNFTKLMLCLPVAHMKKRARAAQQKRASQLFLGTIGAGKSGKVLPGQAAVEAAPQNKWKFKKKKLRNLLSLERMLGTALVHAFMDINQLLTDTLQQTHIASACNLPWSTPPGRDFGWFTEVFKELITACQGGRWYHYSQLFQMVFLQERDAGFRPTQALANVLRVGCPSSSLADSPMVDFEVEGLHRSLPKEVERQLDTDDEAEVMSVWATALALELYEGLPFSWAMDPQCKPTERVSLGDTILRNLQERPSVGKTMLPTLRAVAARQVAQWQEAHLGSLAALRQRAESDKWKLQGTAGISREGLLARIGKWTYGSALFILTSHPLVAIYRVKSTEAFSRAERLFVQINVFIVMLSCTMAFYYSRTVTCCVDLQSFVGCPGPSRSSACLGYPTCRDLLTSARSVEFPEELAAADFTCTAFPQNTWTDRIWMALCINAVVIPINVLLMALFLNSGSSGIPGHAGYKVSKAMEQLVGPKRGAVLMSLFTFLYAIFFDFKMLTKAMAMAFMAFFSMLFKPVATVSKYVKPMVRSLISLLAWPSTLWSAACRALWAATWRMVPMAARKRIERMTPRNSPFIDPLVKHDIQIQGMIDNIVDKIAYCLLAVFWGMTVWILLTYGMLIRQTMGAEAERELIKTWGMVLLSEQFGLGALKLMLARSAGLFVNQQYGQLVAGKDANDILQWGVFALTAPQGPAADSQFLPAQSSFPGDSLQVQQQHSQASPGSPLERPQSQQQQASRQQQRPRVRVGPSAGRSGASLERTYSQHLPVRSPAVAHSRQQPQSAAHLAKHTPGRPRRAQQLLLQRGPESMEHTHLEQQELLQSEVAVPDDAVQQQLTRLAATQQPSLLDPSVHPAPSTTRTEQPPHRTTPSTAESDVDLDAPTISRAEYEMRRARRKMRRPSWGGAPAPSPPIMADEDGLSETGLLVFTAQADGITTVASVEREVEPPPAERERSSPGSTFSFGTSQKTGVRNSPVE
ncbi:hypothetical protein CYMTET_26006 [Cymbomonas tetramitiformis]|uniref:EGF-like domain-containing protein n=1 Tax=Cymbomonas tetramitiformis TaxID=36881 RepID=A0AAE0FSY8_9CHLO|nr:hypothetical protein CYMTET_26006 [Cymbomonas tetramitiformis]